MLPELNNIQGELLKWGCLSQRCSEEPRPLTLGHSCLRLLLFLVINSSLLLRLSLFNYRINRSGWNGLWFMGCRLIVSGECLFNCFCVYLSNVYRCALGERRELLLFLYSDAEWVLHALVWSQLECGGSQGGVRVELLFLQFKSLEVLHYLFINNLKVQVYYKCLVVLT